MLVQRYYTEDRAGFHPGPLRLGAIEDFKGADIRGQVDVTVLPGSIEPRTRDGDREAGPLARQDLPRLRLGPRRRWRRSRAAPARS
jgi:hypothetical protein